MENRMLSILLASREHESLARFAAGLWQKSDIELLHVDSAADGLKSAERDTVDLVVVGEELTDMTPVEFVTQLVRVRPTINCAMVSNLSHDDFHEATEGLGVLMQLPPNPSGADAEVLLQKVEALSSLFTKRVEKGAEK